MRTPSGFSLTRFPLPPGRTCRALFFALSVLTPVVAHAEPVKVWATGAYSFSDELGGFRITGASGIGTKEDPLVITEELNSATPVTLTIRTTKPIQTFGKAGEFANGIIPPGVEPPAGQPLTTIPLASISLTDGVVLLNALESGPVQLMWLPFMAP